MYQVDNNLSFIYDINGEQQVVSISFDINQKSLLINCTCSKGNFCHHTDHMVDYIYNSYFHYDEIDKENLKIYNNKNKLWLPVSEEDCNNIPRVIDIELLYCSSNFNYYCSCCSPGIHTLDNCRHLDYIIMKFAEHYYDLKEQNEEINNLSLDDMSFNNDTSMETDN